MRYAVSFLTIFLITLNHTCVAQNKAGFTYPEDIVDSSKKDFEKQFSQGRTLYTLICSKCHNINENKKTIIPDFSLPQLMDYEMRIYPEHANKLSDAFLTDVEMTKIILFLRYKEKSGRPVRPPSKL